MALSANVKREVRSDLTASVEGVASSEIYSGAYLALGSRDHGTAANIGRVYPYNDTKGAIPFGFATARKTIGGTAGPTYRVEADLDARVVCNCPVSNLTGDYTDQGRLVYATDDGTFDITAPTIRQPIGIVVRFRTAALADVYFFDFGTNCAIAMAGSGQATWLLGIGSAGATTGNMATGIVMPCHGRITSCYGIVIVEPTDADVVQAINLEIDGTNVTGGVITFQHDSALGTKLAGTAITAANTFKAGDLLDIETTASTAGTVADPGLVAIYATVLMEPGT